MADARSQLLAALQEAASQDYVRMRRAEEQLKQWENEPHFFAALQDIFYDPSVDHDVRFLGGIYLKNGVERFWRKTAKHPIHPDEKNAIRTRLVGFLKEPSKKLTAQNAVIASRIARMDYPRDWPDVLPQLVQSVEAPDTTNDQEIKIVHDRAFEMLYEVLLGLSSRPLSAARKQFAEVAPRVFQTAANAYVIYTKSTIQELSKLSASINSTESLSLELNIATMCVKCLRILLVNGIRDVHKYDETKKFIEMSKIHIQELLQQRATVPQQCALLESLENLIDEHGALYLALQKAHPVSCAVCPAWPDILAFYWHCILQEGNRINERYKPGEPMNISIYEQFLLQGMLLIKDTIRNFGLSTDSSTSDLLSVTDEEKVLADEARSIMRNRFLTDEFINSCIETLISKYMLLSPSDLEKWEEDPEGWAGTVESENWEFELRPCAEMTLVSLLNQYRDQLCPIILDLVDKVANVSSYHELLFKDAVYAAVGLGVQSIYGRLDFEVFVANRLIPEIANKEPSFRILRRRIAWLLGKWVDVGISADTRVAIYQGLLDLLSNESDMVVRLTAAHSLKAAIDDWDFEISILLPFLGMAMDQVLKLLSEVEETDTIMKLVADLNAVIDRTGEHMVPHAPRIIEILVPYWSRAEEEPLFQSALVVTFTKIAGILQEQSTSLQQLFLPIIQYAVDRNNKAHVYLLEDALDLWWTILQTAPASNPQLQSLVPSAITLLDYDNESLRKVLKIIESYILLDPQSVLQQFGPSLFAGLASYVGSNNENAAATVSHTVEVTLQACPVQTYGDMLLQSGLLGNVLNVFVQNQLPVYAFMSYMGILSRLAVCDAGYLVNFLRLAGQQVAPGTDFLDTFLDKWLDKFDTIGHPRARKLTALALANLLATQDPVMLNKLPSLMAVWTDVLAEIRNAEEDAFLYDEADMQGDLAELDVSAEKDRRMELRTNDPVYTSDLAAVLRHLFAECERNAGGGVQFQEMYLSKVDPTLLEQMNTALADHKQ